MEVKYQAVDDKLFNTEKECLEWEEAPRVFIVKSSLRGIGYSSPEIIGCFLKKEDAELMAKDKDKSIGNHLEYFSIETLEISQYEAEHENEDSIHNRLGTPKEKTSSHKQNISILKNIKEYFESTTKAK